MNEDPSNLAQTGAKGAGVAEVTIDDLTLGPYGVARRDGKTVLIANTAPGDRAEVELAQEHRGYAIGKLRRVLSAGPGRRGAPCRFLPACGGCDWQHLAYPEQIAIKARLVAREFERRLGFVSPVDNLIEPAAEFGYRSRLRLKVGARGALGFFELNSNRLVPIDRCLVAADGLDFDAAGRVAQALAPRCDEIEIVQAGARQVLVAYLTRSAGGRETERVRQVMAAAPALAGVVLRHRSERVILGDAEVKVVLEQDLELEISADAFSQVNRDCNRKLIESVVAAAQPLEGAAVLDLFCGAGNLSLPLARRGARLLGVDSDEIAIAAAKRNAARHKLENARFIAMKAAEVAPFLARAGYRPDVVVLDPPRTGAREVMAPLAALRPPRVLYVSCDIATAIRDLIVLRGGGYSLAGIKGFDFFPNTHHTEILAVAVLT